MEGEYRYNHFVPNFIVKGFSTGKNHPKIYICDYREKTVRKCKTKEVFGQNYLYLDENSDDKAVVEKDLNTKIEQKFAPIAKKIIESETGVVQFSAGEIDEIRRFFLSEYVRVPSEKVEEEGWEKHIKPFLKNIDAAEAEKCLKERLKVHYPGKSFKKASLLYDRGQMLDDLKTIIKNPFREILDDDDCSMSLANTYRLAEIADIGIWRCNSHHEFILTDSHLINESDELTCDYMMRNMSFLLSIFEKEQNPNVKDKIKRIIYNLTSFGENIWFLPISADIMIVFVNPIFRELFEGCLMSFYEDYSPSTKIPKTYLWHVSTRDVSSNAIEIQRLDSMMSRYVNALMLDRIQNFLGFRTGSKIIDSLEFYHDGALRTSFDYKFLMKELKEKNRAL